MRKLILLAPPVKEYNDTRGTEGVTLASVAGQFPGVSVWQLQRRVSGNVEVDAKMGRPASLTKGDKASLQEWVGEATRSANCVTPVQFNARMQKLAQTNGTPYVNGTPSASSIQRAKKGMPSFASTTLSCKRSQVESPTSTSLPWAPEPRSIRSLSTT